MWEYSVWSETAVLHFFWQNEPSVCINAAAYTAVDKAEDEVELCDQINHLATKELAKVCKEIDYCEPHTCDFNHKLGKQNSQRI